MAIEEAKLHEEIIYGGSDKEEFNRRITSSFGAADRPTAVFTHQDSTALEVYKLLRKLNLKVPDDVALVGCFNTPWSEMMDPSLTSLSIREDELGRIIAETIAKNTDSAEDIYIKPELIVRKSSGSQLDS